MAKAHIQESDGNRYVMFHCVACKHAHSVPFGDPAPGIWGFNGDLERPSITPSLKIFTPAIPDTPDYKGLPERTICHVVVTDGILNYCTDCPHELKGQSVPMIEWSES